MNHWWGGGEVDTHSRTPWRRCGSGAELPWRSVGPPGRAAAASGRWRCVCRPTCRPSGPLYPEREEEGERGRKRWVRSLIHFISSWETHIFFFFSLQKCKEHHFLYRLNVRRRKPLMNQCCNLSQSKWRYFKGTVHSNDRALVLFADVQTLVQHNETLAPAN